MLRLDPILVSRLLRMVSSAYYGILYRIESIAKAVVFIGLKNLRNLVVIDTMKDCFLRESEGPVFSRKRLRMHCTAVGVCVQMISRRFLGTTGKMPFWQGFYMISACWWKIRGERTSSKWSCSATASKTIPS